MARPQTDHEAMREQILQCAEDMVRERGPVTPTVTEIAAACGMSQSNVYRFFENKEALFEATVERWFREFDEIMKEVVESDLDPREKLYQFFARRLVVKQARYADDPDYFDSCMALGEEHHEVVKSYVDLADHYMAQVLGEAIGAGEFPGYSIDRMMSLVNMMLAPFCDPMLMTRYKGATTENLRIIIDAIFDGMAGTAATRREPLKLAS